MQKAKEGKLYSYGLMRRLIKSELTQLLFEKDVEKRNYLALFEHQMLPLTSPCSRELLVWLFQDPCDKILQKLKENPGTQLRQLDSKEAPAVKWVWIHLHKPRQLRKTQRLERRQEIPHINRSKVYLFI